MVQEVLQIGNRVEICSVEAIEKEKITGEQPRVMFSQVLDLYDDGTILLSMPVEKGKLILLSLGVRYEFVFYTSRGQLYRCIGQIIDRFKDNNMYVVKMVPKTGLTKYQRREYYRMQCVLGMQYYQISEELALKTRTEDFPDTILDEEIQKTEKKAVIVDISGGGIRFVSTEPIELHSYLAIVMHLTNENINKRFVLPGYVISSNKANNFVDRYENRLEFRIFSAKIREQIIKYIFDEDRKQRKKGLD